MTQRAPKLIRVSANSSVLTRAIYVAAATIPLLLEDSSYGRPCPLHPAYYLFSCAGAEKGMLSAAAARLGVSCPTAAISVDNRDCSCRLTRVRPDGSGSPSGEAGRWPSPRRRLGCCMWSWMLSTRRPATRRRRLRRGNRRVRARVRRRAAATPAGGCVW